MASEFIRYPYNLGQPPFDKWVKFSAMSGRHVIREKPMPEQNNPDRAIGSVGLYLPTGALKSDMTLKYDDAGTGSVHRCCLRTAGAWRCRTYSA
jgi:hypothetical protein